jgi:hypothetical protein
MPDDLTLELRQRGFLDQAAQLFHWILIARPDETDALKGCGRSGRITIASVTAIRSSRKPYSHSADQSCGRLQML